MRKTWPLLLLLALGCGGHRETAQQLNAELNQAVPHLADPGRVIAVLDSLQIQHSRYDPSTRAIRGTVRDSSSTLLHRRSIRVAFVFDEQGRLRQRTIASAH
jgi:hypothetical protein